MFKNQLQELAQRSCFNLPSYSSIRQGPDHAPRFKAFVNFNGEIFESPSYSSTLRQAEHYAAEAALSALSSRCSKLLTARVLDETGVYKNLLQETAHKAGLNLPLYTTVRSGPAHLPVFISTVELAGLSFNGLSAKTKKQAEKNAAIAAWLSLKTMSTNINIVVNKEEEEKEQVKVTRMLSNLRMATQMKSRNHNHHNRHQGTNITTLDDVGNGYNNQQSLLRSSLDNQYKTLVTSKMKTATAGWSTTSSSPVIRNQKPGLLPLPPLTTSAIINLGKAGMTMAPSVQTRSIIPVCASPPALKEGPSSSSTNHPASLTPKERVPS